MTECTSMCVCRTGRCGQNFMSTRLPVRITSPGAEVLDAWAKDWLDVRTTTERLRDTSGAKAMSRPKRLPFIVGLIGRGAGFCTVGV